MKRLIVAFFLLLASPAQAAFTPPELFVRTQRWDTHEETGPWLALASAPALNYLGGYEIGYRLQDSAEANEFQSVALSVGGVPDGAPTQPGIGEPYCVGRGGAVGSIVAAGPELQFEGSGAYTVKVSVGPGSGDCLNGPSTTASFSVDVHVTPFLVGSPFSFRAVPVDGFVGVQAAEPPGGEPDVRCALDGTIRPDGSVAGAVIVPDPSFPHPSVVERVFSRPGTWTCVARGVTEGRDDEFERATFGTPWSGPLTFDVRSDFRRRTGTISRPRARTPRFTFVAEWPAQAAGGQATVRLYRVLGCRKHGFRLRKSASYRGRFDARRMRITVRRPRAAGYYFGRFTFAGTRFLRSGDDVNPMLLHVERGLVEYATPQEFPYCP